MTNGVASWLSVPLLVELLAPGCSLFLCLHSLLLSPFYPAMEGRFSCATSPVCGSPPSLHPAHNIDKQVTGSPVAPSGPLPSSLGLYSLSYTLGLCPLLGLLYLDLSWAPLSLLSPCRPPPPPPLGLPSLCITIVPGPPPCSPHWASVHYRTWASARH